MNKQKILKQIFSTGNVGPFNVAVVRTPRFLITNQNGKQFWLDGKTGLLNGNDDWLLKSLRRTLTHTDLCQGFAYRAVDSVSLQSEERSLHLALHEHGRDVYEGKLAAPYLANQLAFSEDEPRTAEQIAGLDTNNNDGRIVFNLVGSEPSKERSGFDRVCRRELAIVWFNSKTGAYMAEKTELCKQLAAPLAEIGPDGISNADLVDALLTAPEAQVYQV